MTSPDPLDAELSELRDLLAAEAERTSARISALDRDYEAIVQGMELSSTDDEHDPEGSTTAVDRSRTSALLDSARRQLTEVDSAQERLSTGTYGRCEGCDEAIPRARLLARPTARTCVACADRAPR
ncbi:TraR/DksA family transcriptional regulator [Brachybacterium sacelli]|uniref:RNA polymerase-binding transcription factor DksA n=1 Tax=Brachybacterium sacelli TaxID=173364 RepID=A0ABS4WX22_9MICO|nr:TraR/DksA family transcriptional regulator [Brachybacterium sacelli]MBP2380747.1 RNA polymerase-binding transcription factor DksA [Brachybacterium sacelli]